MIMPATITIIHMETSRTIMETASRLRTRMITQRQRLVGTHMAAVTATRMET